MRYGWKAALSVDRAWRIYGTLPPPTTWQSRSPLWDEAILDALNARFRNSFTRRLAMCGSAK
jgi:hypothetical protein